jgi:hypothetical protein
MHCKDCKNWKPQQSELGYSKFYGICTSSKWKFDINGGGDVVVFDRKNISSKCMGVQRFESQNHQVPIGEVDKSNYLFVTEEKFGCIHFSKTKVK